MTIVLLIGAAPYRLDEDAARWLMETIRRSCTYNTGFARDVVARACLQLADVIAEDLDRGDSPEPIELGRSHVDGLLAHVFRDDAFWGDEELTTSTGACSGFAVTRRERNASCLP